MMEENKEVVATKPKFSSKIISKQVLDLKGDAQYITYNDIVGILCKEGYKGKNLDRYSWLNNNILKYVYSEGMFFRITFRTIELPKRCVTGFGTVFDLFIKHLSTIRTRVNKRAAYKVVNCLVKNISLLKFYKSNTILYIRGSDYWKSHTKVNKNNISNKLFLELIDFLVSQDLLMTFSGAWGGTEEDNHKNISSMLIASEKLIAICTDKDYTLPNKVDQCLRQPLEKGISIKVRQGKDKVERPPKRGEIMKVRSLEDALRSYNQALEERVIEINGVVVPELFFHRVFTNDLEHGGRWYDDGKWLSQSKRERLTCTIDGEDTVSLDYHCLHPSILYAREGIDLEGRDPYKCDLILKIDKSAIQYWQEEHDLCGNKYDPARNLKKVALLCMINSRDEKSCCQAISKEIRDDLNKEDPSRRKFVGLQKRAPVKEIVAELRENNKEIGKYFFSDYGIVCQNMDSKMVQYCIDAFDLEGSVVIPVHDSLTIKGSEQQFGLEIMHEAYEEVVGSILNCKVEVE